MKIDRILTHPLFSSGNRLGIYRGYCGNLDRTFTLAFMKLDQKMIQHFPCWYGEINGTFAQVLVPKSIGRKAWL